MPFQQRLLRVQEALQELNCDALLVDDTINLFYLTGMQVSSGRLVVHKQGAHLIVDGRYIENCKRNSPFPVVLNQSEQKSFFDLLRNQCSFVNSLAFETTLTSYQAYIDLKRCINQFNIDSHTTRQVSLIPVENLIKKIRSIKDAREILLLREAALLATQGFNLVCSLLKEGISEIELAVELEIFWKRQGSQAVAFEPIIAFGTNSSMPHYRAGKTCLKRGDCVLIDIGVNLAHYHSDMTRVVFFGDPNPKLIEIYGIVREAQKKALEICRPGTLINDLDAAARSYIASRGYGEFFTHSLGHGLGLEIHESPLLRKTPAHLELQAGMAITIEPGIYIPDLGGVRIEDTVIITPEGHENLTNLSKEIKIIH